MTFSLPSQNPDSTTDRAFERGFIFGRQAIIRAMREAINNGANINQTLEELADADFRLQLLNVR